MRRLAYWGGLNVLALWLAVWLVPGVRSHTTLDILWAGLILALINGSVGPILRLVTCPMRLLTLGLFSLVVNLLVFLLATWASQSAGISLQVTGWLAAIEGALVVSLVTFVGDRLGSPFYKVERK